MDEGPILDRAYYSIGEVCELTGLKPHVLRYWETQFEALGPTKNQAGNRVYRPKEIELVLLLKHLLYEEKYTIEGAKRKLDLIRRGEGDRAGEAERFDPAALLGIRAELEQLRETLTLSSEDESE